MDDFDIYVEGLVKDSEILVLLEGIYKEELPALLSRLESNEEEAYNELYDCLLDLLINESEDVGELYGAGPYNDVFPITIMKFGPIYWVSAPEFDDMGTFDSYDEAYASAESRYDAYIYELEDRIWEEVVTRLSDIDVTLQEIQHWLDHHYESLSPIDRGPFPDLETLLFLEPKYTIRKLYKEDAEACRKIVNVIMSKTKQYDEILRDPGKYHKVTDTGEQRRYHQKLIDWGDKVEAIYNSLGKS